MAAPHEHTEHNVVLTETEARGGETGHNVRYVLAFGMTGVIAVFAAIALYQGYDTLHARVSEALAAKPTEVLQAFAPYAALVLVAAIAMGLLLGVWSILAGRSEDTSQILMRARVVGQFVLIGLIMAILAMTT